MCLASTVYEELRGIAKVFMEGVLYTSINNQKLRLQCGAQTGIKYDKSQRDIAQVLEYHRHEFDLLTSSFDDDMKVRVCDIYQVIVVGVREWNIYRSYMRVPEDITNASSHLAHLARGGPLLSQNTTSLFDKTFVGNCLSQGQRLSNILMTQHDRMETRRGLEVMNAWFDECDTVFDDHMDTTDPLLMPTSQMPKPRLLDAPNQTLYGLRNLHFVIATTSRRFVGSYCFVLHT